MAITKLMEGLPNQSMSQADFDQAAGKLMAELPQWGAEANALAADVNAKQSAAADSATASANSATASQAARTDAESARNVAELYRDDAQNYAASADSANTQAQAAAAAAGTSTIATSTSSVVMGNGSKTFTVQANKQFAPNQPVVAASGANRMFGTVTSYSGTTLVVAVTITEGTGTFASWTIAPSGAQGATGGTAGGTLTDALNEKKGTAPASSATPDIWGAGGNYVPITQTAAITGFPNAPQAGSRRRLFIVNGLTLTSGGSLTVLGGTRVLSPGDMVEVTADTVSTFYATITRGNGLPVSSTVFMSAELYTDSANIPLRKAGPARAVLVGCGGSGATRNNSNALSNATVSATGGAAGGMAVKDFDAQVGNLVFVAGAPGVGAGTNQNGNAGGVSTLTGQGLSLIANGGAGGTQSANTATALPGAVGGTATGGDLNVQGGNSGSCAANVATGGAVHAQATGGGAVGWRGTGYPSGNVNAPATPGASQASGTGGAGVGGRSGDANPASNTSGARSGGGGSVGASPAVTDGQGAVGRGQLPYVGGPLQLTGSGDGLVSGREGGGSPCATTSTVAAGAMAGSGAVATQSAGALTSGTPGLGAGSGAAVSISQSATLATSAGGGAFLLILS